MIKKIIKFILPYGFVSKREKKIKQNSIKKTNCFFEEGVKISDNISLKNVSIGKYTYVSSKTSINLASIGKYCSIGHNVKIGIGLHPSKTMVSSHPAFFSTKNEAGIFYADKNYFKDRNKIIIGNDVWVGDNVIIKDGVKIGDGAIIGVGAVVVKDVASYSIAGGVPAKLIKYRFEEDEIKFLEEFKWWNKPDEWIKENWKDFLDIKTFIKKWKK